MNITSKSGSTTSNRQANLNDGRHESSDEAVGRRRWVAPIAGVAVTAVGTAALAAGLALPGIVGGLNLGNHNETLLSSAVDVEPPERRNRSRRRVAVSMFVVTGSLALGAAAFGSITGRLAIRLRSSDSAATAAAATMKARAVAGRRSRGRPPRDVHAPAITGPAAAAAELIAALADRRQVGNAERVAGRYAAAEAVLLAAIEAAASTPGGRAP
jgi:hypothetical protein